MGFLHALPKDAYFDDDLFFEVPHEEKEIIAEHHDQTVGRFDYAAQMKRMSFSAASTSVANSENEVSMKC